MTSRQPILKCISRFSLLSVALLSSAVVSAQAPDAPEQLELMAKPVTTSAQLLKLNGSATRSMLIWDVYRAELFLENQSSDAAKIIASPERKRMVMTFLRSASASKIHDGWSKGLRKNAPELDQSRAEVAQFLNAMPEVSEGDVVGIFLNGTQVVLRKNDKILLSIIDAELARTLPKVWLGDNPPSDSFKNELLGLGEQ